MLVYRIDPSGFKRALLFILEGSEGGGINGLAVPHKDIPRRQLFSTGGGQIQWRIAARSCYS